MTVAWFSCMIIMCILCLNKLIVFDSIPFVYYNMCGAQLDRLSFFSVSVPLD